MASPLVNPCVKPPGSPLRIIITAEINTAIAYWKQRIRDTDNFGYLLPILHNYFIRIHLQYFLQMGIYTVAYDDTYKAYPLAYLAMFLQKS